MIRELTYWQTAIRSGFASFREAASWVEAQSELVLATPRWWTDLRLSASDGEAIEAISRGLIWVNSAIADGKWPAEDYSSDSFGLYLGFLYLRYERGDVSLATLLHDAGHSADGAGYSSPPCDEFFDLLNELESRTPAEIGAGPIESRVRALFEPKAALAISERANVLNAA